jgi:hypothetical protein
MLNVYRINYEQIIEDVNIPSVIRLLAMRLMMKPMMLIGNFFANLSDTELEELRELAQDPEVTAPELLLLTMMLSAAEGTSAVTEEELQGHIAGTIIFISTAILHRNGLVTANFQNFSYGSDMEESVLAEPTGLGREYLDKLKDEDNDEQ